MRTSRSCVRAMWLTAVLATAGADEAPPVPDTVLWRLDLPASAQRDPALPAGAAWGAEGPGGAASVRLALPPEKPGATSVRFPIDLRSWRGSVVALTCQANAETVSQPAQSYNGVKCMLHWRSPSSGNHYSNENGVFGSFDWKLSSCAEEERLNY